MKMKYHIMAVAAAVVALSSCSGNILDREPLDIISDAQVYKDQKLADDKLTLAYTKLRNFLTTIP